MLPIWRIIPRTQNLFCKSLQTGTCPTKPSLELPVSIFGQTSNSSTKKSRGMNQDIVCVEGVQGETKEFSVSEARRVMSLSSDYQCQGPSVQGTQTMQENYVTGLTTSNTDRLSSQDVHSSVLDGLGSHVSLHGCMQTTVPHPVAGMSSVGYGSHLNMPGGGNKLLDKYLAGSNLSCHQSRNFSTGSISHVAQQGAQESSFDDEYLTDPSPQGIQGDNCVSFKLWMENCQRYNLPNCDEQLESLKFGRKTLAEVFQEQQEIIRLVAEQYKKKNQQIKMDNDTNAQGQQDYFGYSYEFSMDEPCPQGLQGDDCANYKVWAHNCRAFGFGDCQDKMTDISSGRRSLQDVFDEQDEMIHKIVSNYQQKRQYSTSSRPEVGNNDSKNKDNTLHSSPQSDSKVELSQKDKLKRAVKEYGGTVIVFHVGISLMSLGGFYMAVSSGIDVVGVLMKLGVGESILQSKVATGSTTFVVAYAVHKVFAPVRIGITLSCVPFLVRYLRRIGILKPPKIKSQ